MHRGYFALWRKFQEHPFWKEKREFSRAEAWIDLLWEAQHKKEPQQVIIKMKTLLCNYAESLKSMETWARRWGWSKSKVKRFFDLLVELNQIRYANEIITTRITILNYSEYDPKRNGSETQTERPRNGCETVSTTDNNVNNEKNEESLLKEDKFFDLFWLNYPKKVGKDGAKKAWKKVRRPAEVIEKLKVILPIQIESEQWQKNNGQFIPNPATYINQGRWEDEVNG